MSSPKDWKRLPGCPQIIWMKTVQDALMSHKFSQHGSEPEACSYEWHYILRLVQAKYDDDVYSPGDVGKDELHILARLCTCLHKRNVIFLQYFNKLQHK